MDRQSPEFASAGQPIRVAVGPEDGEDPLAALLLGSALLDVLLALWRGIEDDGFRPLGLRVAGVDLVAKGVEVVHRQLRVVAHVGGQSRVGRRPCVLARLVTAAPQRQALADANQGQGRLAHGEPEVPASLRSLVLARAMPATLTSLAERMLSRRLTARQTLDEGVLYPGRLFTFAGARRNAQEARALVIAVATVVTEQPNAAASVVRLGARRANDAGNE
jgi:hypothetical protein